MKRSSRAALLSGLILPGVGHIVLKQYVRGSVLILFSLIALSVIVTGISQRALTVVDRINSGDIPVDASAIADMVSKSTSAADSLTENLALLVLGVCWLIGIIDSYRIGVAQEK
jgi:uncharacterized membrane protein HdeD (DUF308 family)